MDPNTSPRGEVAGGPSQEETPASDASATAIPDINHPGPAQTPQKSRKSGSIRVSLDGTYDEVLAASLKKYQIGFDHDQYALWITWDDEERLLGVDDKPLRVFKRMKEEEGKDPMFVLRRKNTGST